MSSGTNHVRTMAYSIPEHLKPHIDLVYPMTLFAVPQDSTGITVSSTASSRRWSSRTTNASCTQEITLACIQQLYGVPAIPATSSLKNAITVTGYLNQFPQVQDLQAFLQRFRPDIESFEYFTTQSLDGGVDPQGPSQVGVEANLDIQYTMGIATGVPVNFLSVKSRLGSDLSGFLDTINYLSSAPEAVMPTVVTTSYGYDEASLSPVLMRKLCNALGGLGARGVSVLFSTGDGGVAGARHEECTAFLPAFPASCPYVTAVGATAGVPEIAASLSAGGFSNVFDAPTYQMNDVHDYLSALGNEYVGLFNPRGRGYPDVAAYGMRIFAVNEAAGVLLQGTSASAPIFASVVALLNDRRLATGKRPFGFLNPWLYASSHALTDVVSGSNPGCGTDGFAAALGWDPVTGLGSPNFKAMLAAAGVGE